MAAKQLMPGETEIAGDPIPVTIDGFLWSVFTRDGLERAQVKIPSDNIAPGAYQVIDVDRKLVRVPALVRGPKI